MKCQRSGKWEGKLRKRQRLFKKLEKNRHSKRAKIKATSAEDRKENWIEIE